MSTSIRPESLGSFTRTNVLNCCIRSCHRPTPILSHGYIREHEPHTSRMSSFDANTPQLKVAKRLIEAYASLDTKNVAAITSRNYQYQALPEVIGIPGEAKEEHIERFKKILGAITKAEVCIQHGGPPSSSQTNIFTAPRSFITK